MHVKFINPKGSPVAAVNYVCRSPKDGEQVTVLRGDPEHVSMLAESLGYKHKYSSAVIAWHHDDKPTDDQVAEVLQDFEHLAFAGLDPSQYTYLAVQHTEPDGTPHIHIIIPRYDMGNDRSLNVAPPNSLKTYDTLRDFYNMKYHWKSPDIEAHPENARTLQLRRDRGTRQILKEAIGSFVENLIMTGDIRDRATLVEALKKQGLEVKEQVKRLVIKDPTDQRMKKGMRLQGTIYEQNFNIKNLRTDRNLNFSGKREKGTNQGGETKAQAVSQQSLAELETRFRRAVEKRAKYHAVRHPKPQQKDYGDTKVQTFQPNAAHNIIPHLMYNNNRIGFADHSSQGSCSHGLRIDNLQQSSTRPQVPPKWLAFYSTRQRKTYRLTHQQLMAQAEAIARLIEAIAYLFGLNINLSWGFRNDRNRNQISRIVNQATRANETTQFNIMRASTELAKSARQTIGEQRIFEQATQELKRTNQLFESLKNKKSIDFEQ